MSDQPLIQFNPGMKPNDMSNVVARFSTESEMHEAARLAVLASQVLAGPMKALQRAIDQAPADAVQLLQQELGAQVIGEQPVPQQQYAPQPALQQQYPQYNQMPPTPQPNGMAQMGQQHFAQQYAQQPQAPAHQAPPQAVAPSFAVETGTCQLCDASMTCADCGGGTNLIVITARTGKQYNKHSCTISGHKGRMCKSPAWRSKVPAAQAAGQVLPADLVVG